MPFIITFFQQLGSLLVGFDAHAVPEWNLFRSILNLQSFLGECAGVWSKQIKWVVMKIVEGVALITAGRKNGGKVQCFWRAGISCIWECLTDYEELFGHSDSVQPRSFAPNVPSVYYQTWAHDPLSELNWCGLLIMMLIHRIGSSVYCKSELGTDIVRFFSICDRCVWCICLIGFREPSP